MALPVLGAYYASKNIDQNPVKRMFRTTTHADSDIFTGEDVMPEFSIDLGESLEHVRNKYDWKIKSRSEHIDAMMHKDQQYDILVIGGGASGAGVALDAASRGLKVALIDKNDFGAATSSRSTKLAHGGVRYLEQIIKLQGNVKKSFHLLKEALAERNYFLDCNPFANKEIKIIIPDNSLLRTLFWNFPGVLVYHSIYLITSLNKDFKSSIHGPKIVSPWGIRKHFPTMDLIKNHWGTMMHECQFTDTRQCLLSILTSSIDKYDLGFKGSNIANYVTFEGFVKDESGKIIGAHACDDIDGKCFTINAK
jgi:glycerol-3-phosphate dehydrogenase